MPPTYDTVIVFGPTGDVGGHVALEAHKRGAKVWLAMRDISKPIKALPSDLESSGNFVRIQADLTDAASVSKAIAESGAKSAFVYVVQGDFGAGTLHALRDGGVENIVLLTGYAAKVGNIPLREIPSAEFVAYRLAQLEIAVEDLGLPYFTALKPASFASNYFRNYLNRAATPLKAFVPYEDSYADNIAPEDIGAVGGVVLVAPPAEGKTALYLAGPEGFTAKQSWELIKKVSGRDDIDTTPTPPEVFVQALMSKGLPETFARSLVGVLEYNRVGLRAPEYKIGADNIRKYLGREPTSFVEYLEKHKAEWQNRNNLEPKAASKPLHDVGALNGEDCHCISSRMGELQPRVTTFDTILPGPTSSSTLTQQLREPSQSHHSSYNYSKQSGVSAAKKIMSQTPHYSNVIVFGPTGLIGGLVALEAEKRGAKVWLAMRDTSKPIDHLPADVERNGNFARVQADLTDSTSVGNAIAQSGAKAAYLYLIFGATDFSRGALKALRDGGVENIVFLSSFGVRTEGAALRAIPPSEVIPYRYAQIEIGVEELGFPYFTALKPGSFASNYLKNYLDTSVTPPKAQIVFEDSYADSIAPEDIAGVGAAVLVSPPAPGKTIAYLCGPEPRTAKDAWALIKKVTGRNEIETTPITPDAFLQRYVAKGSPEVVPKFLLQWLEAAQDKSMFSGPEYEAGVANVRKYLGREPMGFLEYLETHKAEWQPESV
uniref:NmrA-like domain-containing protein n=1 Tax=Mycena chlorophos TaxID=658473 RepID=A0ABQ0MBL1_MYCCL|nr:predicted protein [Mycena chlorophos]